MAPILVRVQSENGIERINVSDTDALSVLQAKIERLYAFPAKEQVLALTGEIPVKKPLSGPSKSLKSLGIGHGDIVYLSKCDKQAPAEKTASEEAVDVTLHSEDGKVMQVRGPMCRHGLSGMCDYCMPLQAYDHRVCRDLERPGHFVVIHDEEERKGHQFKHISFHSWMKRGINGLGNNARMYSLDDTMRVTLPSCSSALPPPPIVLNQQVYRHIDYLQFESMDMVDRFIGYWRQSGLQRVAWMYGTYHKYPGSPLGISAVVSAIYEPPQHSTEDSVEFLDDENAGKVDKLATLLGMRKIGWIVSDLAVDKKTNQMICTRSAESYFLTSEEIIFAAEQQTTNPNVCRYSKTGTFGSKFMSCVISAQTDGTIQARGFQVTDLAAKLWEEGMLLPVDNPTHCRIKVKSEKTYVPEVFYKKKDEYNNAVQSKADPYVPNDIFLVQAAEGAPTSSDDCRFQHCDFVGANRLMIESDLQNMDKVAAHFRKFKSEPFVRALSDFNLIQFLACNFEAFDFNDDWPQICQSIVSGEAINEGYEIMIKHACGIA